MSTTGTANTAHKTSGRCPFRSLSVSSAGRDSAAPPAGDSAVEQLRVTRSAEGSGACPFRGFFASRGVTQTGDSSQGSPPKAQQQSSPHQPAKEVQRECPLGFGTASEPKIDGLNCSLCGTLLFDCVALDCSHRCCRRCIEIHGNCGSCGKKPATLRPDGEMQGVVDLYISAHSSQCSISQSADGVKPDSQEQSDHEGASSNAASFFLDLGLQSMSAGNLEAARARFLSCAGHVKASLEDSSTCSGDSDAKWQQLAAVQMTVGDCCKGLGRTGEAVSTYAEACISLQTCTTRTNQVNHNLAIALNKMGDIQILTDAEAAAKSYRNGLDVRRASIQSQVEEKETTTAMHIDLAVSLVKLGNVLEDVKQDEEARQLFSEARQLLSQLDGRHMDRYQEEKHVQLVNYLCQSSY